MRDAVDELGVSHDDEGLWASGPGAVSVPFSSHPCGCRKEHAPPVPWTHRHHVWPLYAGGPDIEENIAYVCPATHDWAHVIWRAFETHGGAIETRRQAWPHYAYELALRGWTDMMAAS